MFITMLITHLFITSNHGGGTAVEKLERKHSGLAGTWDTGESFPAPQIENSVPGRLKFSKIHEFKIFVELSKIQYHIVKVYIE